MENLILRLIQTLKSELGNQGKEPSDSLDAMFSSLFKGAQSEDEELNACEDDEEYEEEREEKYFQKYLRGDFVVFNAQGNLYAGVITDVVTREVLNRKGSPTYFMGKKLPFRETFVTETLYEVCLMVSDDGDKTIVSIDEDDLIGPVNDIDSVIKNLDKLN